VTSISATQAREALAALAELAGVLGAPHIRLLSDFIDYAAFVDAESQSQADINNELMRQLEATCPACRQAIDEAMKEAA